MDTHTPISLKTIVFILYILSVDGSICVSSPMTRSPAVTIIRSDGSMLVHCGPVRFIVNDGFDAHTDHLFHPNGVIDRPDLDGFAATSVCWIAPLQRRLRLRGRKR